MCPTVFVYANLATVCVLTKSFLFNADMAVGADMPVSADMPVACPYGL